MGTSNLPESIQESVSVSDSAIMQESAMLTNLLFSNAVSQANLSNQNAISKQQSLNEMGNVVLGKAVERLNTVDPMGVVVTQNLIEQFPLATSLLKGKSTKVSYQKKKLTPRQPYSSSPENPLPVVAPVYLDIENATKGEKFDIKSFKP